MKHCLIHQLAHCVGKIRIQIASRHLAEVECVVYPAEGMIKVIPYPLSFPLAIEPCTKYKIQGNGIVNNFCIYSYSAEY